MIAHPTVEKWALLCCTVQSPLEPIVGTDLVGVTVRVPRMSEATLSIQAWPNKNSAAQIIRGLNASPPPPTLKPPPDRLIRTAIDSAALGERRGITIYLPPRLKPKDRPLILYLADDAAADFAPIAEALIHAGRVKPVILVGIDAAKPIADCQSLNCDRRGKEYKIDFNSSGSAADSDFARHLRFITDELIPYVEQRYGGRRDRVDRGIGGWSNGGHWALAAGGLRADLFGKVLALSSSGQGGAALGAQLRQAVVFAGAGIFEPDYLKNTMDAAEGARRAHARVRTLSVVAGHEKRAWQMMFAAALPWLTSSTPSNVHIKGLRPRNKRHR